MFSILLGTPLLNRFLQSHFPLIRTKRKIKNKPTVPPHIEGCIKISSDNKTEETVILDPQKIVFIESNANYLHIHYISNSDQMATHVLRKTLKSFEDEFDLSKLLFIKCHRSFIINLNHIIEAKGGTRKFHVMLHGGFRIPVSRSKIQQLKSHVCNKDVKN